MRILLSEDHRDTSEAMSLFLRREGHTVVITETIVQAKSLLLAEPFDILICDVWLFDGEAWELAWVANKQGIPAIAVTGLGDNESITRAYSAGFAAHLLKPIELVDLEKALYEAARSYQPRAGSERLAPVFRPLD